jgi:uncharacterized protein YecA (UPF0149 family)
MDTRTGEINTMTEFKKKLTEAEIQQFVKQVGINNLSPKKKALIAAGKSTKVGRNDKCPCSSGKKFKKCCLAR